MLRKENYSYELAVYFDLAVYYHVLIWFEDFTLPFGYAIL